MEIAVIGGSGLIGTAVVKALADRGLRPMIFDIERPVRPCSSAGYRYFDLTDPNGWSVRWDRFGAIIIAAALLAKRCNESPSEAWLLNVTGTLALLNALGSIKPTPSVIFTSSASIYDRTGASPPFAEDAKIRATDLYNASKICIEAALVAATEAGLLKALILRPFTVYGAGPLRAERGHLFGRWIELGRNKRALTIHGDGRQYLDCVSAEYVAEACVAYISRPREANLIVTNVCSGRPIQVIRLAELFISAGLAKEFSIAPATDVAGSAWGATDGLASLIERDITGEPERDILEFLDSLTLTQIPSSN